MGLNFRLIAAREMLVVLPKEKEGRKLLSHSQWGMGHNCERHSRFAEPLVIEETLVDFH